MDQPVSGRNTGGIKQISGQLCKYTNVVKGWQYRWFTVDPQTGTLSYYICENNAEELTPPNIVGNSPRWQEHLAGAVVCPSDEDSRTFTIGTANGDTLKLRANNARARQEWVDALRNIAECHTQSIGSQFELLPPREIIAASDAFGEARQQLQNTESCNAMLTRAIENVEPPLSSTDPDLLLLKAISAASTHCLFQCMNLLQRHHDSSDNLSNCIN